MFVSKILKMASKDTFFYFGYGSNLLRQRIQIQNPTAKFISIAKLKNFQIDFNFGPEPRDRMQMTWRGCPATLREKEGGIVWGVLWELAQKDLSNLDSQEGVALGIYKPIEVTVETAENQQLTCRSYQLCNTTTDGDNRPSPQYLDVILRGARQNKLPEDYIGFLKTFEHNNYQGTVEVYENVLKLIGEK